MAGSALGLRLLLLVALCGAAAALWPWPHYVRASPQRYRLRPAAFAFRHHSGSAVQPGCDVLDAAFTRYRRLLFGAGPWPPPSTLSESRPHRPGVSPAPSGSSCPPCAVPSRLCSRAAGAVPVSAFQLKLPTAEAVQDGTF